MQTRRVSSTLSTHSPAKSISRVRVPAIGYRYSVTAAIYLFSVWETRRRCSVTKYDFHKVVDARGEGRRLRVVSPISHMGVCVYVYASEWGVYILCHSSSSFNLKLKNWNVVQIAADARWDRYIHGAASLSCACGGGLWSLSSVFAVKFI